MITTKYLYGASVRQIQKFIFETERLAEIAGGSEIVKQICTEQFNELVGNEKEPECIIQAAGNIKAIFTDKEMLNKVFREFPRRIAKFAPGVNIVQAVVELDGDLNFDHVATLEKKLRERHSANPDNVTFSIMKRNPETGHCVDGDGNDPALSQKRKYSRDACDSLKKLFGTCAVLQGGKDEQVNEKRTIENLVDGEKLNFVAVIHADGNSLGLKLSNLNSNSLKDYRQKWHEFSAELDHATCDAAYRAFAEVFQNEEDKRKFLPVIVGGDDLTVICAAKYALRFTNQYLKQFEEKCNASTHLQGITACAGIAFVKPAMEFHYAVDLAEKLCTETKKYAKRINLEKVPSSFMFHRELSGFIDMEFDAIRKRELTAQEIELSLGAYSVNPCDGMPCFADLETACRVLPNSLRSGFRRYETALHSSREYADFILGRMEQIANQKKLGITELTNALQRLTKASDRKLNQVIYKDKGSDKQCCPVSDLLIVSQFLESEQPVSGEEKNA